MNLQDSNISNQGQGAGSDRPEPVETIGIEGSTPITLAGRLPSGRKKLLGAAAFTFFWCGLTGVFIGFVAHAIYKSYDAHKHFVTTEGTVLTAEVKTVSDSDGDTYKPLIKYSYVVDGVEHTSVRYAVSSFSSSNRSYSADIVEAHPSGKKITVWYDPREPDQAAISIETSCLYYFLLLFLQPFILVGLGGIVYTLTMPGRLRRRREFLNGSLHPPWTIPCWGTLQKSTRGLVLHRRRRPFFALAMGYGLACFAGIFVVVIRHGLILGDMETMPSSAIANVFAIAAAVGLLAMLVSLFRRATVFEIDRDLASLHLKSSKREFTVNFAEIDYWFLKTVVRSSSTISDSGGKNSRLAPLLALTTIDGSERPIHVFGVSDEQALIAEKVAMEFAKFTAKPFEGMKAGETPSAPEPSVSGAISFMRAQSKAAKQYSDLN